MNTSGASSSRASAGAAAPGARRASSSAGSVMRRSRSTGAESSVVFGRTSSVASSRAWTSTSRMSGARETKELAGHPLMHAVNVDELAAVDVMTFGGASGSVRLERYDPSAAVGRSSGGGAAGHKTPYSLRDPVKLTVGHGTVTVATAPAGVVVCVIAFDHLTRVTAAAHTSSLLLESSEGQRVAVTVHSTVKLAVMHKLLRARITGCLTANGDATEPAPKRTKSPPRRAPQLSALTPPLTRAAAAPGGGDGLNVSAISAASGAPTSPGATPRTPPAPGIPDRDARREALYAQLRAVKEQRLGRPVVPSSGPRV